MRLYRFLGALPPFPCAAILHIHSYDASASLNWTPCASNKTLRCATLPVPVDWSKPDGDHIDMFVTKLPASDSANKIGSLIVNPGGPGVPGEEFVTSSAASPSLVFPPQFDIGAPDPRGVGKSHPIQCDPNIWNRIVSYQPTTEAKFQQLLAYSQALGASCRNLTGPLLGFMDSYSVVRDFEALRVALGDEKLTYLGLSYGTVIGQAYAELFPDKIRAMAFNGNLDLSTRGKDS